MFPRIICALLLLFYVAGTQAEEPGSDTRDRLTFVFGPYVYHYHYDVNHNDTPWLTGFEWGPQGWWADIGAVYFENSFSQPSVYVYAAKRWFVRDDEQGPYLKLTGGPLYGYRGQYENRVPFNHNGLAWGIIPGIGYQYHSVDAQLVILGTSALLLTFGYDFSR